MDFFGKKSDNAMFNDFPEALNGGSSGVSSSSLFRTSDVERLKKNNGFDPLLDDSSDDDFIFNGWGGLEDEE